MKDLKVISQKFLGPATDLMNRPIILEDLTHSTAVAEPKEFRAPEVFTMLAKTPVATGGLTNKGMEVTFGVGAFARPKPKWPKTGARHGKVSIAEARSEK
jgi:hypothetical protein